MIGQWPAAYAAMIPGALSAMAIALFSQRQDWQERILYMALFAALGWSFGGSMPIGQVIGYIHSDYIDSVSYGTACLFLIGALWAFAGAAFTALPACAETIELRSLTQTAASIAAAWLIIASLQSAELLQPSAFAPLVDQYILKTITGDSYGIFTPLFVAIAWCEYYGMAWIHAASALLAVGILSAVKRECSLGSKFALYAIMGWWLGFIVLIMMFGFRMAPPQSETWAGMLGMVLGIAAFLIHYGFWQVLYASILAAFWGGMAFTVANTIKLHIYYSDPLLDFDGYMRLIHGFVNGLGIAMAMGLLCKFEPGRSDGPSKFNWRAVGKCLFAALALGSVSIHAYQRWPMDEYAIQTESLIVIAACVVVSMALIFPKKNTLALPKSNTDLDYVSLATTTFIFWIVLSCVLISVMSAMTLHLLDAPTIGHAFRFGRKSWEALGGF